MSDVLAELGWPGSRLGEALETLGRWAGLGGRTAGELVPPVHALAEGGERLDRWVEAAAGRLGLEAEPIECPHAEVGRLVAGAGPALARLPGSAEPRFLALLGGNRRRVRVLTPMREVVRVSTEAVRAALCRDAETPIAADVDRILAEAGVSRRRRPSARAALLGQLLVGARVGSGWLLRPAGDARALIQAREAGLPRRLALLLAVQALGSALWIGSWWLLGQMSTTGRLDLGWLLAWLLLLLSTVPCRLALTAVGGSFTIRVGALLKRRLLLGALALGHDEARRSGIGQFYGRVLESQVIELMGLAGGFLGLSAVLELALAVPVLAAGAGGWPHAALLLASVGAALALGLRYYRSRHRWTEDRLNMTNDLVERMVGHRTRLAQEPRARRNDDEDRALERYLEPSRRLDHLGACLQVMAPRGWLLVGLLGLAPAFVGGTAPPTALAVGLGGVVLAYRALRTLAESLEKVAAAAIAWEHVGPLWRAAERREPAGQPDFAVPSPMTAPADGRPRLDARDLIYRYHDRSEPVLRGATVVIGDGARILLQGRSGGGKSTLAALLAGLRVPESGLLLWDGLDRGTLGAEGWRRRVALAPQFHENHVLMGTFAFNLLMGRGWPPRPADLEEAERVCRGLALGPLLDRMPAGIHQTLGETGWQLSHGERSRLYLARALLQGAELIILDESFAALDPRTLRDALAYVLEEAPMVLVVAHP
jgi:ATP-binding cassette, subfamily B, bacterial